MRKHVAAILAVAVVVASVVLPASHGQASQWEHVATHPQASQQSTAYGTVIRTLQAWNGLLYPGYGDYGANTGPVRITPFDPSSDTFRSTVHTADTEQVHLYRPIGDRLFAPSNDTRSGADLALGEPWAGRDVVSSLHVYDVVESGGDLWMAGSSGRNATMWRSTDGGSSWSTSLSVPPTQSDDWARFYFAGVHDGRVYAQAHGFHGRSDRSKMWTGSSWADGPDLLVNGYGQSPREFAEQMVYLGRHPGGCSSLAALDGSTVTRLGVSAYDYVVDGDHLYALSCGGEVRRTSDLSSWETVTSALDSARSLAVVGDDVYAGTSDARIYKTAMDASSSRPAEGGGGDTQLCVLSICLLASG